MSSPRSTPRRAHCPRDAGPPPCASCSTRDARADAKFSSPDLFEDKQRCWVDSRANLGLRALRSAVLAALRVGAPVGVIGSRSITAPPLERRSSRMLGRPPDPARGAFRTTGVIQTDAGRQHRAPRLPLINRRGASWGNWTRSIHDAKGRRSPTPSRSRPCELRPNRGACCAAPLATSPMCLARRSAANLDAQ